MTYECEDLILALEQIRDQNRQVSAENMQMKEELRLLQLKTDRENEILKRHKKVIDKEIQEIKSEWDVDLTSKVNDRREKKKQLLKTIREKTNENEAILNDIRSLEHEIVRLRMIQQQIPKIPTKISKSKTKKAKSKKAKA